MEGVGLFTEITERKQMEQQLQEAEELYRSLVEDTLVGVYIAYIKRLCAVAPGTIQLQARVFWHYAFRAESD